MRASVFRRAHERLSFKSRQIGRVNRVNLAFCNDERYMSPKLLATTGCFIGYDFLFNDIQDRIDPFDNEAYRTNPMRLVATATDIVFGTADYLEVKDAILDLDMIRASTSMPLLTPPVELGGHSYLDGASPIRCRWSMFLKTKATIVQSWCSRRTAGM